MRAVVPLQHAALRFAPLEAKYLQTVTLAINGVTRSASTCNRKSSNYLPCAIEVVWC